MAHTIDDPLDLSMQICVQHCTDCSTICTRTIAYCLTMGGRHAEASHLKSLLDCAEASAASVHFMLRGSALYPRVCSVCAAACAQCATSCERFANDAQMQACAEVCRRCEASCREMAGASV